MILFPLVSDLSFSFFALQRMRKGGKEGVGIKWWGTSSKGEKWSLKGERGVGIKWKGEGRRSEGGKRYLGVLGGRERGGRRGQRAYLVESFWRVMSWLYHITPAAAIKHPNQFTHVIGFPKTKTLATMSFCESK